MRILVCGGRFFNDAAYLAQQLNHIMGTRGCSVVVHGAARGADTLAGEWAKQKHLTVVEFPADWGRYGRAAGPKRNALMLKAGEPDLVVAFPGGRGTADMVRRARRAGVEVIEIPPK